MNKRRCTILLVCLLLVQLLPIVTGAENQQGCTIGVQYRYQNTPLAGADFDIYRIGTVGADGSLILAEPYASYPVDTEWLFMGASDIANLIYNYLLMDGVSPMDTITIGADGMGSKGVPEGLYLVAGRKHEDDHVRLLNQYLGKRKINVVVANNGKIDDEMAKVVLEPFIRQN